MHIHSPENQTSANIKINFNKFGQKGCKQCRKMLDIEDMKKFIILAIVLVFVFGGGIGIYIGFTKQNKNNISAESESDSKEIAENVEVEEPFIVAKEKLILALCDNTANICASVHNLSDANLKFAGFDNKIINVDSLGNVKPLQVGETNLKSFVEVNGKEYAYTTKVIVLPLDIEAEINLVDENENPVTNPLLGEKYILKMTTNVNIKFYDLSLMASNHVKVFNNKTFYNGCSCEVYFESKTEHSLQFKLVLNADNIQHTILTDKFVVDNSEKLEEPDEPEPSEEPDDNTPSPSIPSEDNPDDTRNPDKPSEDKPNASDEPSEKPAKQVFSLSSSAKDIEITDSTIRISGFTKEKLVALAFKILNSTKKYSIRFEILEGNNIDVEIETSMIGLDILSKGILTMKLFALEDPSISQTFTIIVE